MKLTIAVTGGVACGKSLVSSLFEKTFPAGTMSRFNCDEAVASLYQEREVQERIQLIGRKFGVELISEGCDLPERHSANSYLKILNFVRR
jgi:dephospho-CoA kinase